MRPTTFTYASVEEYRERCFALGSERSTPLGILRTSDAVVVDQGFTVNPDGSVTQTVRWG